MGIDRVEFRRALGSFASGVTVVTTRRGEEIYGLTVSAFCSLSLIPPLVLVCIDKGTSANPLIAETGIFAVNILSDKQQHLSSCFAMQTSERYENFCHAEYTMKATGSPILTGCVAYVDCRLLATHEGGDHTIFIGQIEALEANNDTEPLLYFRGQYRTLG